MKKKNIPSLEKPQGNNSWIKYFGIIIVFLLIIIGVLVYLLLKEKNDDAEEIDKDGRSVADVSYGDKEVVMGLENDQQNNNESVNQLISATPMVKGESETKEQIESDIRQESSTFAPTEALLSLDTPIPSLEAKLTDIPLAKENNIIISSAPTVMPSPTSVLEKKITPSPTSVLVKKITPSPTSVLVERITPSPTSVLVERITPSPTSVLVERITPSPTSALVSTLIPSPSISPVPTTSPKPTSSLVPSPTSVPVVTQVPKSLVVFEGCGGVVPYYYKEYKYTGTYGSLPYPSRSGYLFAGWYTSEDGGNYIGDYTDVIQESSVTLYAHWIIDDSVDQGIVITDAPTPIYIIVDVTPTPTSVPTSTVIFDGCGGTVPYSSKNYEYGTDYGILPVPVRDGFNFNGWYTSEIDGNHISDYSEVLPQSNITFYAHWTSVTHTLSFDPDGGICSLTSKSIVQGNAFGELPIPTKDYYSFTGWVFMDNTPASESSIMGASDVTIKATWYENPTSDWVRMNEVPEGAKVFQYKWTYDETEKKESYDSSIDGWTQTGSEWRKSGEGSVYYAYFPSTFDTSNWIYTSFYKEPLSEYENATNKRYVSNSWEGYVYWHWMYDVAFHEVTNRAISDRTGTFNEYGKSSGGLWYGYFNAFCSSVDCPYLDNYYCCSRNQPSYNCSKVMPDKSSKGTGTTRYFRFDYYVSSYTDYTKVFFYTKTVSKEADGYAPNGDNISNVIEWVRYIRK